MRRIRYSVAASLDGFIAGPKGEFDWIIMDPQIDFEAMYKEFDTVVMGRRTFEASGSAAWGFGMQTIVISRTLHQKDHPDVTIVKSKVEQTLTALRKQPGKDIWLFGGGVLFRNLLEMGLVDTVEVALMPILLGGGIPLFPGPFRPTRLKLTDHKLFKSGIVTLVYGIERAASRGANRKAKRAASLATNRNAKRAAGKKKSPRRARSA
ncbi:MAG TPA: dihydrofolate reductase family protein [Pirellulales bacterium]|nr:dihydrofolate reductase family protein [Pirellulales bacterium]